MAGRPGQVARFTLVAFGLVGAGILLRRRFDAVLRIERLSAEIHAAASAAGVPSTLLAGLVYAESRGLPEARSPVGAEGLCQLMPDTARELALRHGSPGPPFTPEENLRLGAWYLRELLDRWDGDREMALLSYRLGPARVAREIAAAGGAEAWKRSLQGRKPSPWEYVVQVERFAERFRERGD